MADPRGGAVTAAAAARGTAFFAVSVQLENNETYDHG